MVDRVHADAVAQQRAARLAARWVDRDHRDRQRVLLVEAEAADQFVGQRRLAGAAGAGDAEDRGGGLLRLRLHRLHQRGIGLAVFQRGNPLRQRAAVAAGNRIERRRRVA
ncbi:hypothetical protein D9M68_634070 [compost metagenome]